MSWNQDKNRKKPLFLFFMAFYYLFKIMGFCVRTQQILGEIKCPFFSFCLLFSTVASWILKPKKTPCDLSALIVLQWGFREIITTLRHKADVPVMTWQQKGVCFSFTSSLFLIPYQISFPSTRLSFPWVWCLLVGAEGQEQLLQHVHCEATCVLCCAWPWHTSTQVLWVSTQGFAALLWIHRPVAVFMCHTWDTYHPHKPSHHSYLSKTSQLLSWLHVPAMRVFPWGCSFASCLGGKGS